MARPREGAWRLLGVAVFAQATISVAELGVPTIAPFLKEGLGLSTAGVGALIATINIGRILGSLPAGRAVDRLGEYVVMVVGGVGVAVCFGLTAFGGDAWMVGALFVMAGVFAGSASPAGARLVLDAFPAERRGLAMGIRQSAVPLGGLGAALLLPPIAENAGWHWALLASGGVALFGAVVVRGMKRIASDPALADPAVPGPLRTSVLLRHRGVLLATAWGMIIVGGQYAVLSYLVLDLTTRTDASVGGAAALLAIASGAGALGRVAWGLISDEAFGGRSTPAMLLMSLLGAVAAAMIVATTRDTSLVLLLVTAVLAGLSFFGWQGVWMKLLVELAPPGMAGTTTGFGLTFVNAAIVVWPPLFGLVTDAFGSFRPAWAMVGGAVAASMLLIRPIARNKPLDGP